MTSLSLAYSRLLRAEWLATALLWVLCPVIIAAAVFVAGPLVVLAAAAGVIVVVAALRTLDRTIAFLIVANVAAVATGSVHGIAPSGVGAPLRTVLYALLGIQALRTAVTMRVPRALIAPVVPLLLVTWVSIALAPSKPTELLDAPAFTILLLGTAALAWPLSHPVAARRTLLTLGTAYAIITLAIPALSLLSSHPFFLSTASGPRLEGVLENPNSIGLLGFAGVPVLVGAGAFSRRPARRLVYFACAVLLTAEVLASVSRSGITGLMVAGLVLVVGLSRRRFKAGLLGATVLVSVVGVLLLSGFATDLFSALRLSTATQAGGRVIVWTKIIELAHLRPILGYGYGSSLGVFRSFGDIAGFSGGYSGNVFMDLLLELGLAGVVSFFYLLFAVARRCLTCLRQRLHGGDRLILIVWLAVLAGGLINAQGESFVIRPGGEGAPVIWFAAALCVAFAIRSGGSHPRPLPSRRPAEAYAAE